MNAQAYLEQLNKLDRFIQNQRFEIAHWKDVAVSCSVNMDGDRVQSSGPARKMENAVVTYSDLQANLELQIKRAEAKRQEIIRTIYEALSPAEYDVLHHIYVQGMMLKEVEAELHKSRSWVSRTHRTGLSNLQKYLDRRQNDQQTDICKKTESGQNSHEV